MYYLFLLMLNSKKLISLSLASALVLSLPLNSLAIGVNDASNYVTSSDYNTKIAELETRIADLEASQTTTDVNTALQTYFNEESTSPIVAGDYITITSQNGKKVISASSKPTAITAGDQHIEVTKTETDSDITFTLKNKSTSYTSNFDTSASSQGVLNAARRVVPDSVNEAWVSGSGKFDLAMLKNNGPLFSGATGTLTGSYKVLFTKTFVSAEIYDANGLYAVAFTPTNDFRSLSNLAFNGVRLINSPTTIPIDSISFTFTPHSAFRVHSQTCKIYSLGSLRFCNLILDLRTNAAITASIILNNIGTTDIQCPIGLAYGTGQYGIEGGKWPLTGTAWSKKDVVIRLDDNLPANSYLNCFFTFTYSV